MDRRRLPVWLSLLIAALLTWQSPALAGGAARTAKGRRPVASAKLDLSTPMVRAPSGILVPGRRKLLVPRKPRLVSVGDFRTQQKISSQWRGARKAAMEFLASEGTVLASARHQRLLKKLLSRAENVVAESGASIADFEPLVIDGPPGTTGYGINAGAWRGGLFTMNKSTIDFAFLIADAYVAARNEAEVHMNLARIGDWQRKTDAGVRVEPPTFRVPSRQVRDDVAEGILGFVVNHEVGHALLNHVGVGDPNQIWLPPTGIAKPPFNAGSRQKETDADTFSVAVGLGGAVKYKEAMTLLPLYWHLQGPRWDPNAPLARGREDASHPVAKDRFNQVRATLEELGFDLAAARIPPALERDKLWVPESARGKVKAPAGPAPADR